MGKNNKKTRAKTLRQHLALGDDLYCNPNLKLEDFGDYAKKIFTLLNYGKEVEPPTHNFTYGTLKLEFKVKMLRVLENAGSEPLIVRCGKEKKRTGSVKLILSVPNPQHLFELFELQRRHALKRWGKIHRKEIENPNLRAEAAHVIAVNVLLIFLGVVHSLEAAKQLGFIAGLLQEMAVFERFVPRESWSVLGQRFMVDALEVVEDWPDEGGFARPSVSAIAPISLEQKNRSKKKEGKKVTVDPTRLAFYLTMNGYKCIRSLAGESPNEYVALIFEQDGQHIVVLDTHIVGNCLFVLGGEVERCLEVAQGTKADIRSSELLLERIIHVHNGAWHEKVEAAINASFQTH